MTNDAEDVQMSELYQSLFHSKWDCKYHVVFVPKRRRKAIFGETRRHLGEILHALARPKECQILEGHLMPDHVHMCIAIPPKHPVSSVIGFLKGKSAIAIARLGGKERNFSGEHFWARGYDILHQHSDRVPGVHPEQPAPQGSTCV
jgi:putative transposase